MNSPDRTVLSISGSAYLMVVFLAVCVTAVQHTPAALLLYLIPIAAAVYVRRTATIVDRDGLTARAVFGSASVPWEQLRGLQLEQRGSVYAVSLDGTRLRLPCVRSTKIDALVKASGGRIPDPSAG